MDSKAGLARRSAASQGLVLAGRGRHGVVVLGLAQRRVAVCGTAWPGWQGIGGLSRHGMARHGASGPDGKSWRAWPGWRGRETRLSWVRRGAARPGVAGLDRHGPDPQGRARLGTAVLAGRDLACLRGAWHGGAVIARIARLGLARHGWAGRHGDLGLARRGRARPETPGLDGSARLGTAWVGAAVQAGLGLRGLGRSWQCRSRFIPARRARPERLGSARQGSRGLAGIGAAGKAGRGNARLVLASPGEAGRQGLARLCRSWQGRRRLAWLG